MATPSFATLSTKTYQNLLASSYPSLSESIVLLTGQSVSAGAILGKITVGALTGAADEDNTGDGTIGSIVSGSKTEVGTYTLTATGTTTFVVVDPNGKRLDDATAGSTYSNNHLGFLITAGYTPFAAGDIFTITVAAGSGKYKIVTGTAVDGSQNPRGVILEAADATSSDVTTTMAKTGHFNQNALSVGAGTTVAAQKDALEARGLYMSTSVTA